MEIDKEGMLLYLFSMKQSFLEKYNKTGDWLEAIITVRQIIEDIELGIFDIKGDN